MGTTGMTQVGVALLVIEAGGYPVGNVRSSFAFSSPGP